VVPANAARRASASPSLPGSPVAGAPVKAGSASKLPARHRQRHCHRCRARRRLPVRRLRPPNCALKPPVSVACAGSGRRQQGLSADRSPGNAMSRLKCVKARVSTARRTSSSRQTPRARAMRIAARSISAVGHPARARILRCRMEHRVARNRAVAEGPAVLLVTVAALDARAAVVSINRAVAMRSAAATIVRAFASSDRSPFPGSVPGASLSCQCRRSGYPGY